MKPRTTLIIAALFAVLAGYVYFFELNKTPEQLSQQLGTPTITPRPYVMQFDPSQVTTLEVADLRAPRQVRLTRDRANWQVTLPTEKAANNLQVEAALTTLANLQATRVLTNVTDLAPFGFITPTLEVRIAMNDQKEYALTIGNKSPNNMAYYAVYTGDKSRVFLLDTASVERLMNWLDTPPYEPTPTPTFTPTLTPTATPPITETPSATETPKP
jgi:hypothetical protein